MLIYLGKIMIRTAIIWSEPQPKRVSNHIPRYLYSRKYLGLLRSTLQDVDRVESTCLGHRAHAPCGSALMLVVDLKGLEHEIMRTAPLAHKADNVGQFK